MSPNNWLEVDIGLFCLQSIQSLAREEIYYQQPAPPASECIKKPYRNRK